MKRRKRIGILLGVLAVICTATIVAISIEEKQEQIRNSEEVILALEVDSVESLSWEYGDTALAFHRDDEGLWKYDEDEAFPVDHEDLNGLAEIFSEFGVSFVIENVEDYSQYGLDAPECIIRITAQGQSYEVKLGDFSKLDSKRYVSIGDGNAYLVNTDPMEEFEITIRDLIENDKTLEYDAITSIAFAGAREYTITYGEDSTASVCEEDVYFTDRNGRKSPLDTDLVEDYLDMLGLLKLTNYVTYNVTEEELQTYGLNDPELTVTVNYTMEEKTDGASVTDQADSATAVPGTYILHVSRSAQVRAAEENSEDKDEGAAEDVAEETVEDYVAYVRVDESPIVYEITASTYEDLMTVDVDELRHKEVFTADFNIVTAMEICLEDQTYSLTTQTSEEEGIVWYYDETEVDIYDIRSALLALSADDFTSETTAEKEELRLKLTLDHEHFPQMEIVLYRLDGSSCVAVVDGEPIALVARAAVVELVEAINTIVLQ